MIRQTEQPASEAVPDPVLAGYRLDRSPQRREAGSLLFAATAPDGSPATLQVSAEPVANRRTRARFRRRARTRAGLDHPALLAVREVGEEGGRLFVATEPFPARSLADLLRDGPLAPDRAVALLKAVADGLDIAHAAGLVHGTFSAESVLLDGERLKLDLFGLFTVVGQPGWGDVVRRDAHLHYESPEAVRGEQLTRASNVYSLTGLLVHALTGQPPFVHHDPVMITYAHVSQPPPKPSERKPELPSALDAIVAQGMAKEPAERPESAGALIAAAARVLGPASKPSPKPAVKPPTGDPSPSRPGPAAPPVRQGPAPVSPGASPVALVAAYVGSPAAPGAPAPAAPVPATPVPRPPAPATFPAEPSGRPRMPLKAWLAPLGPVLLVFAVAAVFGALLGMPGGGSEKAATTVQSPDEVAVQRLDNVRFRLRDDLAFASTADEQADVAGRLAMAYGRAADHLSSPQLVSAAKHASAAYVSLESAARAADENAYDDARARVDAAEAEIDREMAQINRSPGASK
jgi:serine/threonine kinase PknH